jgi:hypothetical protein
MTVLAGALRYPFVQAPDLDNVGKSASALLREMGPRSDILGYKKG